MPVYNFLVSGIVQGVGYRAYIAMQARKLKLQGWVKNLDDGTVEILIAGPAEIIIEFKNQCLIPPLPAKVTKIVENKVKISSDLQDFRVIY
jgi:acylphosphatase